MEILQFNLKVGKKY